MEIDPLDPSNSLLIAMPQLMDPNFYQSVTLLASFDPNGAFGLILNRPLDLTTEQVFQDKDELTLSRHFPLYYGGPVQVNSLWFLHAYPDFHQNGIELFQGLYLTTDLKTVEKVVNRHGTQKYPHFRFFLGYAGWAPGQMEKEIARASWVTCPVDFDEIFECASEFLWKKALRRLGITDPNTLVNPQSSGTAH
jgi:putative transcriptional regulator